MCVHNSIYSKLFYVWFIALLIEFASGKFVGSEISGFIEVTVRMVGGSLNTSVTVIVTPSELSASGKLNNNY